MTMEKTQWTPEQLHYFAQQEERCRKEIKMVKIWIVLLPLYSLLIGAFLLIVCNSMIGLWLCGGLGAAGVIAEGICWGIAEKKLEKIQREKCFGIEREK